MQENQGFQELNKVQGWPHPLNCGMFEIMKREKLKFLFGKTNLENVEDTQIEYREVECEHKITGEKKTLIIPINGPEL